MNRNHLALYRKTTQRVSQLVINLNVYLFLKVPQNTCKLISDHWRPGGAPIPPQLPPIFRQAWLNGQDPTLHFYFFLTKKTHPTCENVQEKRKKKGKSDRSSVNRDVLRSKEIVKNWTKPSSCQSPETLTYYFHKALRNYHESENLIGFDRIQMINIKDAQEYIIIDCT
jgi:hypothetical protein